MKKILLVDDEKSFIDIIQILLQKNGYDIIVACDGEEALVKVRSEHPDLVLLDLIMPKMDGFTFAKTLRAANDIPWIPVIVFTTQATEVEKQKAEKIGVQGYLMKSDINAHALRDKIEEFIGRG
ncbi:MAG: two-component system response regulator [Candidatus Harrisonbacteria bacterium CG10_big_fil_rev_8_21_14_0_10_42_17]|uniref:Two-component system response regulator n=1 Tax=Candidatus Harrisonbacteria bacterium CG10_big_fil_rev_8_21_14_0_10_42_17 TaxID=1974584 RepID=A0A2M6WJE0_9BACT|nr:MAG: two-component system response regulator [Candidatus Harrisonbacteria bacterium CG10_big_fil_rev_8_21_14_0_10_42_17]